MPSLERHVRRIVQYRWLVLVLSLAIAVAASAGISRLVFEGDYEVFFDDDNPMLVAYRDIEDTYTRADSLIFVLDPKGGDVFERRVLVAIEEMTEQAWRLPHSRRVNSLTNFQHTEAVGDDLFVGDLFADPAVMSAAEIAARRRVALSEPMLVNAQVSPSGHVTGVQVTVLLPEDNPSAIAEVVVAGRALAARFEERYPDLKVRLTGSTIISQAFNDGARGDLVSLVPLMYLVMLIVLGILLRSVGAVFITLVIMAAAAGSGLGMASWLGIPLTGPSVSAVTITLMIAVANAVHLLTKFESNLAAGMARDEATVRSLVSNAGPVSLACVTTAVGFLVLNTSDLPPFRYLGNTAALGVAAVLFFCFTLVPALMVIMPTRRVRRQSAKLDWSRFSGWVIRHRKPILWSSLAVAASLSLFVTKNEFNDQFVGYFDPDAPVRADTQFAGDNLTGVYSALYSVPADGPGGVVDPDFLRHLDAFATWARNHPSVRSVAVFTDVMKRLNRSMHGDDADWYRVPESRELAAQYLLLYELSLPFGLDLTDQIDIDKSRTKLRVGFPNITNNEITAFERDAAEWMRKNWPPHMVTPASNPTILFAHIWDIGSRSLLKGLGLAVIVISVIISWAMKSVKLGLISLVPNLLPAVMAFGLWGLIDGRIDISASTVAAIAFGIVIDDTIHFLSRYNRGRKRDGLEPAAAISHAFAEVGGALLYTTVVIAIGFAVLTQSAFGFNTTMGLLTAITVILALLLDFLLLPSLLLTLEGKSHAKVRPQPAG